MDDDQNFLVKVLVKKFQGDYDIVIIFEIDGTSLKFKDTNVNFILNKENKLNVESSHSNWLDTMNDQELVFNDKISNYLKALREEINNLSDYGVIYVESWVKDFKKNSTYAISEELNFRFKRILDDLNIKVDVGYEIKKKDNVENAIVPMEDRKLQKTDTSNETEDDDLSFEDHTKSTDLEADLEKIYLPADLIISPTKGKKLGDLTKGMVVILNLSMDPKYLHHLKKLKVNKRELDEGKVFRPAIVVDIQNTNSNKKTYVFHFKDQLYARIQDFSMLTVKTTTVESYMLFYSDKEDEQKRKILEVDQDRSSFGMNVTFFFFFVFFLTLSIFIISYYL